MKNLKSLGKVLTKTEQQSINGGLVIRGPIFGGDCGENDYVDVCQGSDDCPMKVDPLSGAVFTASCRYNICGSYCYYSLT